jgi:hypothetical protein
MQPFASPLMVSSSANERRFPLRLPAARNVSLIRPSQTPRHRRSGPSGTSKTRSQQSDDSSRSRWLEPSCAARVAKPFHQNCLIADRRDAVELGPLGISAPVNQRTNQPQQRLMLWRNRPAIEKGSEFNMLGCAPGRLVGLMHDVGVHRLFVAAEIPAITI